MENDFNFKEKYNQLYKEYRKLYTNMLKDKQYQNLTNMSVIELSILTQNEYPNKSRAVSRANAIFMKEQKLNNLKELLKLYEFIKE